MREDPRPGRTGRLILCMYIPLLLVACASVPLTALGRHCRLMENCASWQHDRLARMGKSFVIESGLIRRPIRRVGISAINRSSTLIPA